MKVDGIDTNQKIIMPARQTEQATNYVPQKIKNTNQEDKNNFSDKELENGVGELNDTIEALHKNLKFQIHKESERMMVEVINLDNNEVIKEIPSKEVLDMIGRIREMVGLLLDEKI